MPLEPRSTERRAVEHLLRTLSREYGYPTQSVDAEYFLAPGATADIAILSEDRSEVRAIIEIKMGDGTS